MSEVDTQRPPKSGPLTVITTHINADFDALGSMLAAQKLYPDALVVFPGSQEKNLRNFFIQSMVYLFNLAPIRDIDMSAVKRLVLVDTRRADRIGKMAEVLDNENLNVHIYDHHPTKLDDIHGQHEVNRRTGATVTLLTELIRQKDIPITAEEATIMCLGIYEDTGSFTFSSTTAEDLSAAAYLVSEGANINVVSNLISREISPEQVGHLNDLIQAVTRYMINGVEIVVTVLTLDHYLPDFAFLIHKMVRMENINAIFALALMESKIYLVARSRTEEVDAGAIVSEMGGGGHPSAAAATIKGQTLPQAQHALIKILNRCVKAHKKARHLMSSPAISTQNNVSCAEANTLLTRYNINALLVTSGKRLLGYITRQVIEKAIFHKLGQVPIKDYMTTEIATIAPNADILEIQEKIIDHKQRILPVIDSDQLVGVITRTDLLNILVQQHRLTLGNTPDPFSGPVTARQRNIINLMRERLTDRVMTTLRQIGQVADRLSFQAYVVGGFVRDLFLFHSNEDIDIVIEGDGIAFAQAYADQYGARIHSYRKFGTAVIIFNDNYKIDVATARLEYYRSPAALPDVEMSSIKLDLFRRDFVINTLALHLNAPKFGNLIDFFSARKDLKDKAIRVLHNLSFVEDPTRVFRALRFEQRFNFSIGKLTANLITNAVRMEFFKRLSGRRVFAELRLILQEENPTPAIMRMHDFDLLKVIHPSIEFNKQLIDLLNAVRSAVAWHDLLFLEMPYDRWAVYFMALIHPCNLATSLNICQKMGLGQKNQRLLSQQRIKARTVLHQLERRLPKKPSDLYHLLCDFRTELILYMLAATRNRSVKKSISHYYIRLRNIAPQLKGSDLVRAGMRSGPHIGKVLSAILDAKLNGTIETRQEEIEFVRRWIQRRSPHNFLDSKPLNK